MGAALHILLATFLLVVAIGDASAARRLAFVVGINDYQNIPKLEKAVGDAKAMSAKLTGLGFEVTSVLNPTRRTLNIAIADFTAKLKRDDLVFLHFSGHGVEIDGDNILLPADVPKPKSGRKYAVVSEGIGLRRLVDLVSGTGARTRVFIIDACRDNPFEQSGIRSIGSSRGLTRIEASAGTFIMYSAGYRQTALDRLGPDDNEPTSVYTRVLLSKLGATGKSLASVARDVRKEVRDLANGVGHEQRPAYYDELSSALILKKDPNNIVMGNPVRPTDAGESTDQSLALEMLYWNSIKDANDAAFFRSYLERYPQGKFAGIAKLRLAKSGKKVEPKKEQQTAALQPAPDEPGPEETKPAPVEAPALSKRELTLRIQRQLVRHGCNPGRPDGAWGSRSRKALQAFARSSKKRLASLNPSERILDTLTRHKGRGCKIVCGRKQVLDGSRCVRKRCARGQVLSKQGRCIVQREQRSTSKNSTKKRQINNKKNVRKKKAVPVRSNRTARGGGRCPPGYRYLALGRWCAGPKGDLLLPRKVRN